MSRVVPRGRTDRQTDIAKLIVAFHSFANALIKTIIVRTMKSSNLKTQIVNCFNYRTFLCENNQSATECEYPENNCSPLF